MWRESNDTTVCRFIVRAPRPGRIATALGATILAVASIGNVAAVAHSPGVDEGSSRSTTAGAGTTGDRPPGTRRVEFVPVLMYHRISCPERGADLPSLWVCPRVFERTLRVLKAAGWETITSRALADALSAGRRVPSKRFVVVIDDGNRDGYDSAYPILERYDFEAVFAVVVARVSVKRSAMTWTELAELESEGHEIADHSMSHADLRRVGAAGLRHQVEDSADRLQRHLGHRPRTFVYPYGLWNQGVARQVKASGFRIAYTTAYGAAHRYSSRFLSPRIRVNRGDSPRGVLAKVRPYA